MTDLHWRIHPLIDIGAPMLEGKVTAHPASDIQLLGRARPGRIADPSASACRDRVDQASLDLPATVFRVQDVMGVRGEGRHVGSLARCRASLGAGRAGVARAARLLPVIC